MLASFFLVRISICLPRYANGALLPLIVIRNYLCMNELVHGNGRRALMAWSFEEWFRVF